MTSEYKLYTDRELIASATILEEDLVRFEREAEATNKVYKKVREEMESRGMKRETNQGFDH